jgi:hypothetical protein
VLGFTKAVTLGNARKNVTGLRRATSTPRCSKLSPEVLEKNILAYTPWAEPASSCIGGGGGMGVAMAVER